MTDVVGAERGVYFFVSYAHLPPRQDPLVPEAAVEDHDPVVTEFFDDLSQQVGRRASGDGGLGIGFYDRSVSTGEDLKAELVRALGLAEVFVPLYSPRYLDADWPMSEHRSFTQRLREAGGETGEHIQPVLWIPLPPGAQLPPGTDLTDLGAGIPDYAENGLRMLRELRLYREQYHEFVGRLAQRIVDIAQARPIGPSPAPPLLSSSRAAEPRFVVAVLAPRSADLPDDEAWTAYGHRRDDWRPFGEHSPSVAQQAMTIAQRLGLSAAAVEMPENAKDLEDSPSAVLIDPWMLALPDGRSVVESCLRELSEWAIPIVVADVADPHDAVRGRALFDEAAGMLARAESSRIPRGTSGPDGFADALPLLVSQARRRYLQRLPATYPPRHKLTDVDHIGSSDPLTTEQPRSR